MPWWCQLLLLFAALFAVYLDGIDYRLFENGFFGTDTQAPKNTPYDHDDF